MSGKALRVALIFNGRIIEDRTFESGKQLVSVGSAPTNTFCVPMGELPSSTRLFSVQRDGSVTFTPGELEAQLSTGGAEAVSARAAMTLATDAKGRVRVGDVTVLFQMVTPPVAAPPPELPKGARGVTAQLDRSFMVALALSFAANLAGAGYVIAQPLPEEPELSLSDLELQRDRFAAVLMPLPKPPAPSDAAKPTAPAIEPTKPVAARPADSKPAPAKVVSGAELKQRLSKMGMLSVIGSVGGEDGVVGDLLKDSNGVGNVADALRDAKTIGVGSAEDAVAVRLKGNQSGETQAIGPVRTDGVRAVTLVDARVHDVVGNVREERITLDSPDVDPDALAKWMHARRSVIQDCYERELKRNRSLSGRLVLAFNITPRGRVAELDFAEGTLRSGPVETCISTVARNWVLPFTPSDDVRVEFPFIFTPVN